MRFSLLNNRGLKSLPGVERLDYIKEKMARYQRDCWFMDYHGLCWTNWSDNSLAAVAAVQYSGEAQVHKFSIANKK